MVYFLCKVYDSDRQNCYFALSLPVRGAWIEIFCALPALQGALCRSPCGERGLKSVIFSMPFLQLLSLPVRGAWIEIVMETQEFQKMSGRSPCGERGLKSSAARTTRLTRCRSPCGERGLKCIRRNDCGSRGRRSPCGERGLKYGLALAPRILLSSLPVRGAWIEIPAAMQLAQAGGSRSPCGERGLKLEEKAERDAEEAVAPRAGSVD